MKAFLVVALLAVLGIGGYMYMGPKSASVSAPTENTVVKDDMAQAPVAPASPTSTSATQTPAMASSAIPAGSYVVIPAESVLNWAARKPLIEGYINSGTIGLTEGKITTDGKVSSGTLTYDMNTLRVGLTAKKPGKEGALEGHLKSPDFFDVAKFPTATFVIKSLTKGADATYTLKGDLTMKGKTNEVSFPATVSVKDGVLHAEASTEIDRTKWGITYGSGSFFQNLADNMIDDMVKLSFVLVAKKS